jgi:hypothetical protein
MWFGQPARQPGDSGRLDGMNIVQFLEARIAEQEADILGGGVPASLTKALLAECAEKRAILAAWKTAAEAEGIIDPAQAEGTITVARRSMLNILAAGYKDHPDYREEWGQ